MDDGELLIYYGKEMRLGYQDWSKNTLLIAIQLQ